VREPNENDWSTLARLTNYLKDTVDEVLGFEVKLNILYQDNTSREMNVKTSRGKWTRHFPIKLFYVTNLV